MISQLCLSSCLFVCLSVSPFAWLFLCPFVSLSVRLQVCQSVCMFVCLSVSLYVCPFTWMFLCLFVRSHGSLSIHLFVCTFIPNGQAKGALGAHLVSFISCQHKNIGKIHIQKCFLSLAQFLSYVQKKDRKLFQILLGKIYHRNHGSLLLCLITESLQFWP